jgi:hypothetical protein
MRGYSRSRTRERDVGVRRRDVCAWLARGAHWKPDPHSERSWDVEAEVVANAGMATRAAVLPVCGVPAARDATLRAALGLAATLPALLGAHLRRREAPRPRCVGRPARRDRRPAVTVPLWNPYFATPRLCSGSVGVLVKAGPAGEPAFPPRPRLAHPPNVEGGARRISFRS